MRAWPYRRDVVVLIFSGHGVGAEHVHHTAMVVLFLVEGIVLEEAMLLDPGTVQDNLGLLVGGGENDTEFKANQT